MSKNVSVVQVSPDVTVLVSHTTPVAAEINGNFIGFIDKEKMFVFKKNIALWDMTLCIGDSAKIELTEEEIYSLYDVLSAKIKAGDIGLYDYTLDN